MKNRTIGKMILFYVLTFVFTIVLGGIMQSTNNMLISPQYAPTIALLFVCLFSRKWSLFKEMKWNVFENPKWLMWTGIAFALPFAVIIISSLILPAFGQNYSNWTGIYPNLTILFTAMVLGAVFEEIGWRGYLLPLVGKKYNWLVSSIITGVLWGLWHVSKIEYGALGYLLFVLLITQFSIVMTYIYKKTNGNMILMILFHLGINFASLFFLYNREGITFYIIANIIMAVLSTVLVIKNKELYGIQKK